MAEKTELEEREKKVFASERREDIFSLIVGGLVFVLALAGVLKPGWSKSIVFIKDLLPLLL